MTDTTKDKMLQSWANYLLGGSQESQGTMAEGVIEEASHTPTLDHLLRGDIDVEHSDDEWVLISADHLETSDGDFDEVEVTLRRVPSVRELLTRTSSSSSLHSNDIDVEESWFITPPPCFTSTGPSNMRISPFENLLIEHPSMSVYKHAPRRGCLREILSPPPVRETTPEPEEEEDELEVQEVDNEVAIVRRVIRRHRMEAQLQERQYSKYVHSRKIQNQKANKPLKKAYLERNNKAREVNCRNQRQRRGERSQGPNRSRANNNRKC
ncbi:tumor protein p53-inducible nuclear protein 1 isoform X2 [Coccinella septempunctata]|uniref:tumor protein p53-inducible nuclear protein 1 isoform X2 n=1 Tax=Coccinella septempunctata TaxID=41139 RepID=UPI001D08075C|nr:tumor protein p53-inducible nuclear protein 1 isoform X2 [Coccinella septempunctata]